MWIYNGKFKLHPSDSTVHDPSIFLWVPIESSCTESTERSISTDHKCMLNGLIYSDWSCSVCSFLNPDLVNCFNLFSHSYKLDSQCSRGGIFACKLDCWVAAVPFSNHGHSCKSSSNEVHPISWFSRNVPLECTASEYRGEATQS